MEYQQTTPATRVWFEKFGKGELSEVQSVFWKRRAMEELYDLEADPHETVNLAIVPAHSEKLVELRHAVRTKMIEIVDLDLVPESTLYEYEQETGKSRVTYTEKQGFDIESVFDAAFGTDIDNQLKSKSPEIRFWALVNLIENSAAATKDQMNMARLMLESDLSMAVRVKAAELCLMRPDDSAKPWATLAKLADKRQSNYYVACNAVDCLDRFREQVKEPEVIQLLKQVPTDFKEIERGNDNMGKLIRNVTK